MRALSVVIPTVGRRATLARALDRLERQSLAPREFEVIVVSDRRARADVADLVHDRGYRAVHLTSDSPGASAARNRGWRESAAPLVLFLGDDVLAGPHLLREHLDWHERNPDEGVAVVGRVRWSAELHVTAFMRWLEQGVQFDYRALGEEAPWTHFYTANASVKRALLERVGGFDEERFPFLYEDLDLALRMRDHGFRLLYNRSAEAEHLHPTTLDEYRGRISEIARAERRFVATHAEFEPYFFQRFREGESRKARRWAPPIARFVPRRVPFLGRFVWEGVDALYLQQLAPDFHRGWAEEEPPPARDRTTVAR